MKRTNRSSLFGDTSEAAQKSMMQYQYQSENQLNSNVNDKVLHLRNSISESKHIAIVIGDEIRRSKNELDDMNVLMDRTENKIQKVTRSLKKIIGNGGAKYMCWLLLFVLFVFLILYLMIRRKLS